MAKVLHQEPILIEATYNEELNLPQTLSLDVGCGMVKRAEIGIDISKNSRADIIADSHFLPFKDNVFNSVSSTVVLEHSPNPLLFLKEQLRVLIPEGKIIIVTDNAQYFCWSVMGFRDVRHEDYHDDHYEIFFPKNVQRLLTRAGFRMTGFRFLRSRRSKMDFAVSVLSKIGLLRWECLFSRFEMSGRK